MELIRGVKIEDARGAFLTTQILGNMGQKAMVRYTPSRWTPVRVYDLAVRKLYGKANVLFQLSDTEDLSNFSIVQWRERISVAHNSLRGYVKIWDCGNGINRAKSKENTWSKVNYAIDQCKLLGEKSAITLWLADEDQLIEWAQNFPLHPTYVFLSIHPNYTPTKQFDWDSIFNRLGEVYKNSFLGIGEFSTDPNGKVSATEKENICKYFYQLPVSHPRFVGGGFYGYFVRDCVRRADKSVLNAIKESWAISTERKASNE